MEWNAVKIAEALDKGLYCKMGAAEVGISIEFKKSC